ncbi:DUF2487 family protein [Phocicoccus pinnipedialis]|uniref:DUF2487 domain-containing protein n=1 Tax=Phocicoccus pinnipedialis TaxID=110845 RepID=A0A6V7RD91_9BACL|nr:DUF2487 family protein [Jeotgalicoccus pinnipedialis]MBP1939373.1 delta-aminolevulinic acid dehydratase/porphobilinogen synthase [Jeotgalicoccus pinnipedialis]CAD2075632.1 hypothetical protein JEOPIN946_01067 [Jeotgalicoccus pinnipedialis]
MLYTKNDLNVIKDEIEFIDTAIIPVVDIDMDNLSMNRAEHIEFIQLIIMMLEKQLKGRLLITPLFTVVGEDASQVEVFNNQLKEYGFKNTIVLSFRELSLEGIPVIKINHVPISDMDKDILESMVKDEMTIVLKEIIRIWNS